MTTITVRSIIQIAYTFEEFSKNADEYMLPHWRLSLKMKIKMKQ